MPKEKEIDVPRILSAIRDDRKALEPYRLNMLDTVAKFAGTNWTDNASIKDQPVNRLSLTVQVLGRSLIPKNPRVMLSTFDRSSKADVNKMQMWANNKIEDIDLASTLRRARVEGFFGLSIVKVALCAPADASRFSWRMVAGEPYAEIVPFQDWVFDTRVNDMAQASYMGHKYRVPLEVVKDDSRNYSKARKDLLASPEPQHNESGDERLRNLFFDWLSIDAKDGPEDMVTLWEIWCPRHHLIYTFSDDQVTGAIARGDEDYSRMEPLRVQRWIGPNVGPYHFLGDITVPGSPLPKGYLVDLVPLHDAANNVTRKLIRQSERFKSILTTQGSGDEDVERIRNENDGGVCRTTGPTPKETVYGGPHPMLMQALMTFDQLFNKQAGNLDAMGGLEQQAGTLGQERLLAENSSRAIADLQGNTISFVSSVTRALCWYWWHDPMKVMRVKMPVSESNNLTMTRSLTPQQRIKTSWDDLQLKIDPYTMQPQTPSSKLQFIMQTLTQFVLPTLGLLNKKGIDIDMNKTLQLFSSLGDCPELADILTIGEPPDQEPQAGPEAASSAMPAQTNRTYTRRSVSEGTPQGNRRFLQNAMMGINSGGNQETGES